VSDRHELEDVTAELTLLSDAYDRTPAWRIFRRQSILRTQLATLWRYVAVLDDLRVRQINARRRCEGR
jgi:hypothetical protein